MSRGLGDVYKRQFSGFLIEKSVVNIIKNKSSTIKNISFSTRNLFSDKMGKTIIKTHIVGVIRNKDVLFLNSIFSSFFIMYFLII